MPKGEESGDEDRDAVLPDELHLIPPESVRGSATASIHSGQRWRTFSQSTQDGHVLMSWGHLGVDARGQGGCRVSSMR